MSQDPQGPDESPRPSQDQSPEHPSPHSGHSPDHPRPEPQQHESTESGEGTESVPSPAHPEPGPVTPGWGAAPGARPQEQHERFAHPYGHSQPAHDEPVQSQPAQHQPAQSQYGQGQYGQSPAYSQPGQHQYGQYGQNQQRPAHQPQFDQREAHTQHTHPYTAQQADPGASSVSSAHQDAYAYGQGHNPWTNPAEQRREPKRGMGAGGVVAIALVASLLGGGIGAAGYSALSQDAEPARQVGQGPAGIEINTPESATAVTAAAAKASPSVVTLGVADGGSSQGSGSGIVLDDEGHVLTNTHVVTLGGTVSDPTIQVRLEDGRVTTAEIVGTDPLSDLAVIRLADTENLTPAEIGSSGELNVGDQAVAIGAPLGLSGTVTDGIISALDRTIQVASAAVEEEGGDVPQQEPEEGEEEGPGEGFEFYFPNQPQSPTQGAIYLNVIQTDAAINQGNSGGALVDAEGRIIGVNVAIASTGGGGPFASEQAGSIGVGFAIPIDYAQRIAQELIDNGEASHGLLGVSVAPASPDAEVNRRILAQDGPVSAGGFTAGALVSEVNPESPAGEAGLEVGDIITHVEGRYVEDATALTATVREYAAGESISLTVQRDGEEITVDVTLSRL